MPRHVYRVTIELIHSDAADTLPPGENSLSEEGFKTWQDDYSRELNDVAELRGRIMGVPGLVKYPDDVSAAESWGRALRRNEPQVIELDIDRDQVDEKGADRACLMHMVDYLTLHETTAKPYWAKESTSRWPDVQAWKWTGSNFDEIGQDIRRLFPGAALKVVGFEDGDELVIEGVSPVSGTHGWLVGMNGYIALREGEISSWSAELFEREFTDTPPEPS